MTRTIENTQFGGERPLFAASDLRLVDVTFLPGESALKRCRNIEALRCTFEGKYPFWHAEGFRIRDCLFNEGARAGLWYSKNLEMADCLVEAPKMFREMDGMTVENVRFPDAQETLWQCRNVKLRDVELHNADYLFMHSSDIDIDRYVQHGNYSFQYCRNVVIRNAEIHSKDAFWNTENVIVYDSVISGEYLGWHSRNLRLVRCRIGGTQPLCYCHNLTMEDCVLDPDADLCFEDSDLHATIASPITSVKNPRSGSVKAHSIAETIIDQNLLPPGDCIIETEFRHV